MKKRFFWFVIIAFVMAAGCSKDEDPAKDSKESSYNGESKEPPSTNDKESDTVYPFSGTETEDDTDQRMIGVMVNNHPDARPQTGLSKADIVFEILAEGRVTRFLALFQSDLPEVVGPVRSAREYYFNLAEGYDALYVYHGAANFVDDMIQERGVEHINGSSHDNDGTLFKRESFREAPHNSYLQMDAVNDAASEKGYDTSMDYEALPFLREDEADSIDGEDATDISIVYSERYDKEVSYHYDTDEESFMRSSDGEKTEELETEEQIGADNVFIVEAHHEVIDDEGRRDVDLEEGGDGYLLQKGNVQKVEWENEDGRIVPMKDGDPVPFVPGQTWVNVVPADPGLDSAVSISEDGEE